MININNILNSSSIRNDVLMKRNKPLNNIASKEIDNYIEQIFIYRVKITPFSLKKGTLLSKKYVIAPTRA